MGVLAFAFGVGMGLAAWSQRPALFDREPEAFVVFVLLALIAAYIGGLRRGHGKATAISSSYSEAVAVAAPQQDVSVNVFTGPSAHLTPEQQRERFAQASHLDLPWHQPAPVTAGAMAIPEELLQDLVDDIDV